MTEWTDEEKTSSILGEIKTMEALGQAGIFPIRDNHYEYEPGEVEADIAWLRNLIVDTEYVIDLFYHTERNPDDPDIDAVIGLTEHVEWMMAHLSSHSV